MKKPLVIMLSIILAVAVLIGLGIGGFLYVKSSMTPKAPKPMSASEAKNLRVELPQNTTNLKDGLIQFTLALQASDTSTKAEINDMLDVVQDAVNQTMRQFSSSDLKSQGGMQQLENQIQANVNHLLPKGKVTSVYFSTIVVQ